MMGIQRLVDREVSGMDMRKRDRMRGGEVREDMGLNLQDAVAQYDDEDDQEVHITGGHLSMEMETDDYIFNKLEESLLWHE